VSRSYAIDQIRPLLFSTALLAALLGFGMFFDHLAERHDRLRAEAAQTAMNEDSY
jgi:hypothetical protein